MTASMDRTTTDVGRRRMSDEVSNGDYGEHLARLSGPLVSVSNGTGLPATSVADQWPGRWAPCPSYRYGTLQVQDVRASADAVVIGGSGHARHGHHGSRSCPTPALVAPFGRRRRVRHEDARESSSDRGPQVRRGST